MNVPSLINFPANVGWVLPSSQGLFIYHAPAFNSETLKDVFNDYLNLAHDKYNSGDFSGAYFLLQECHKMDSSHLPTLLLLGCTCYSLKYYNLSIFYNNMILGIDSQFAEAYSNLATTHRAIAELFSLENNQEFSNCHLNLALHFYKSAIKLRPKYWDANVNLAGLFSILGRIDEALLVYSSLENHFEFELQDFSLEENLDDLTSLKKITESEIRRNLNSFGFDQIGFTLERRRDISFGKGNLYLAKNNIVMAKLEFFKGIIVSGIDLYAIFIKSTSTNAFPTCFITREQAIDALNKVEQGLVDRKFHMVTSAILQTLAKIYQDHHYLNVAIELYYLSLKLYPTPSSCNNLGIILSQQRLQESIQWYELGLTLDPKHVHLYTNLGSAFKDIGRIHDGISMYQQAISIQPDFYIALANLANVYKDLGDVEDALTLYKRALDVKPDFIEAFCNFVNSSFFICDWEDRDQKLNSLKQIVIKQLKDGLKSIPPLVPTVLPFHTFTYSNLDAWIIREISRRNADRTLWNVLSSDWFPGFPSPPLKSISNSLNPSLYYPYPIPEKSDILRIGYVSSDFVNHPLAHLMQSVFGFHNRKKFKIYGYSLSPDDNSTFHKKIQESCDVFRDVSSWPIKDIVEQIALVDHIHILVNLNGYTKGGRNEIFAARPAPLNMSVMGYAGTMGAGTVNDPEHCPDSKVFENSFLQDLSRRWMDYLLGDDIVCPRKFVCGERLEDSDFEGQRIGNAFKKNDSNRVYTEGIIYMPHTYFVNDHRQGFREEEDPQLDALFKSEAYKIKTLAPDEVYISHEQCIKWRKEQVRRIKMRRELFPNLKEDTVIFANFNQLYKLDPEIFEVWMNILKRLPNSVLWLLRFPHAGEKYLMQKARKLVGEDVASRIIFTDVAPKHLHIARGKIADIFLDTPECNAHTTAADILWSGTPLITFPKYDFKMCSRVAASVAFATGTWGKSPNPCKSACSFAKSLGSPRLQDIDLLGHLMVVDSYQQYESQAISLGSSLSWSWKALTGDQTKPLKSEYPLIPADNPTHIYTSFGLCSNLRQCLFLNRESMPLFDTDRWVRDYETGLLLAFERWENSSGDSRCIHISK